MILHLQFVYSSCNPRIFMGFLTILILDFFAPTIVKAEPSIGCSKQLDQAGIFMNFKLVVAHLFGQEHCQVGRVRVIHFR